MRKYFKIISEAEEVVLPCEKTESCPYEYDNDPDRDIEGMPFIDDDARSCPKYGHICPEFMEELGLTVQDLKIRAIIPCGGLIDQIVADGQADPDDPLIQDLKRKYEETIILYPESIYPQYY